jgi:hypothetical protein
LAAGLVLGGTEGLTLPILAKIWLDNWLWTGFWLGIHALLAWDRGRRLWWERGNFADLENP